MYEENRSENESSDGNFFELLSVAFGTSDVRALCSEPRSRDCLRANVTPVHDHQPCGGLYPYFPIDAVVLKMGVER